MTSLHENIRRLAAALAVAFFAASLGVGYWQLVASQGLKEDPHNPRLYAALRTRPRGQILDRDGGVLAASERTGETYRRVYPNAIYEPWLGYATIAFGAAGVEASYATSLLGEDPADPLTSWRTRYLGEVAPPGSVRLSVSARLQQVALRALGDRRGAILALEPRTGEILAALAVPRYDPNPLVDPQRQREYFEQLKGDRRLPLLDRAAQGQYAPGSTFKIVTASAALETGAIRPDERIRTQNPWQADPSWGNYRVRSVNPAGEFDLARGLMHSDNVYFAMVAIRTGGERLADYANRFMIGRDLKLDGPHARGQISNSAKLDRPVLVADTGFGQGELLVTPLHMALIVSAVASGGLMPTPHYGLEVRDGAGGVVRNIRPPSLAQPIRPDTARLLTDLLVQAVEGPGAFAYGARIGGVRVAGKTGSAELGAGRPPRGWFVGFAPAEDPKIAVAVLLEEAARGGEDAAPMGAQVIRAWLGR